MRTSSEAPSGSPAAAGHPIPATPSVDALVGYFRSAAKPAGAFRVGIEQEKIGVLAGGRPVPYEGPNGIAEILSRLATTRGFTAQGEDGHIISLARGADRITVEPGGQLELSGGAQPTAIGCRDALLAHVAEIREVGAAVGARFIGVGARPFGTLDEIPWLPKRRYGVMRSYFPLHGRQSRLAHYMM